jgi:hypothetical protein
MATTTIEEGQPVSISKIERPDLISWGAVIAGIVLTVGISWILLVLGSAAGIAISKTMDFESISHGLGFGVWIWLSFTALISYFFGGWIAAWLSGETSRAVGMLHGVTTWGATIVWMLFLSYVGASTLANTGANLLGGSAKAGTSLIAATVAGTAVGSKSGNTLENSPIVAGIQEQLRIQISKLSAQGNAGGGASISPQQAQQAMNQLNNSALQEAAVELVQGNTEAAKIILVANTNLSAKQVDDLVDGVTNKAKQNIQRFKDESAKGIAAVKSYTETLLWVIFVANMLGLIFAILGGWLGSHHVHHFYVLHRRKINV